MERREYEEKGYLNEDFKVFYLEELAPREIKYHYHSFDKLLIFLKGSVDYAIEGKSYTLLPNDIVLVPRGDPHRVSPSGRGGEETGYTRLVIYLSPQYIQGLAENGQCLRDCFRRVEERHCHVLRIKEPGERRLARLTAALKETVRSGAGDEFGGLYQRTLLLQLLIQLNRRMSDDSVCYVDTSRCNQKIVEIIRYLNGHLTEDVSIDGLAARFYLSKYHMMRQFRAETGYTIGGYINQKRLLRARELLKQGESVTAAYLDSGFREHSTFVRAYKRMFGENPSKTKI